MLDFVEADVFNSTEGNSVNTKRPVRTPPPASKSLACKQEETLGTWDDSRDGGGTPPRMEVVESSRERRPRTNQETESRSVRSLETPPEGRRSQK